MRMLLLLLCLCLSFLSSCGPKKVAVKYADTYLEQQVEKRLPLYDEQEEILSRDIDKFLNDHKDRVKEIMPTLEKIDLEDPNTLDIQWNKVQGTYLDIANDFSLIIAKHMAKFDQKQKKDFLEKMRDENNDIFKRDRKERREKIASRIQKFLGSITKEQEKILKNHQKDFDEQVVVRSERRAKLHTQFKEILEQELSTDSKEKLIHEALVSYQTEMLKGSKNLEIAKEFIPTLTKSQKVELRHNLGEVKELLKYFIQQAY
ncbi:MAG: hypothetical protein ACJ76H_11380 [Bacteriovoracaceae bacterium]